MHFIAFAPLVHSGGEFYTFAFYSSIMIYFRQGEDLSRDFQDLVRGNKTALDGIYIIKQHTPVRACGVACSRSNCRTVLDQGEVRAMEGARAPKFRPYWIRYLVAFWTGENLKWARDNVLIACLCSLAPGLIAAGISAALSDHKWRAAAYATLLTYGGLFAMFLMWRLVATPLELDRENRRFINGLTKRLAFARLQVAALQARPPALEVEMQEIHVQAAQTEPAPHASGIAGDCDIFLRVKLTLTGTLLTKVLTYELSSVWHGNAVHADLVDDIQDWGVVTQKKPVGVGTTFHYTVTRLTQLARKVEQRGVPMEGWLHFCVKGVHEQEIGVTIYRLTVFTRNGAISRDIGGANLAEREGRPFQKVLYASRAFLH